MDTQKVKLNQKLKLLLVLDLLVRQSDENNPVDIEQILLFLKNHGIVCERKSVYNDISILKEFGYDILHTKTPKNGYFLASREFEEAEIRLLCDAVLAANFISPKKSAQLCEKILKQLSVGQAKEIQGQVYFENSTKSTNESIYYNVDKLNRAIRRGRKVALTYRRRIISEQSAVEFEERNHILSPYGMIWKDDHYYLVGNNVKYDNIMVLRVDRIRTLEIMEAERVRPFSEVSPYKTHFDTADYAKTHFNMFTGTTERVELVCRKELIEPVLDRFGEDIRIMRVNDDKFKMTADAAVSEGLVSWIMQFGGKMQVAKPQTLKKMVMQRASDIMKLYVI